MEDPQCKNGDKHYDVGKWACVDGYCQQCQLVDGKAQWVKPKQPHTCSPTDGDDSCTPPSNDEDSCSN